MSNNREHEHHKGHKRGHHSRGIARRVRGTLQPRLLLLLLKKPSHGYELIERISQSENVPDVDPGFMYRTLRHLEHDGMVSSSWDMEGEGPAKRLYKVTPEGSKYLHEWVGGIHLLQEQLESIKAEYEAYMKRGEQKGDITQGK